MNWHKQFAKFTSVGAVATSGHYLTLIVLREIIDMPVVAATTLGYLVGALINYWLNFHWTFARQASHRRAIPRFFSIATLGLMLNAGLMHIMVNRFSWWYLLAQVIATGLVLVFNFVCNRLWTFKEQL